jgi:hypothetical protein
MAQDAEALASSLDSRLVDWQDGGLKTDLLVKRLRDVTQRASTLLPARVSSQSEMKKGMESLVPAGSSPVTPGGDEPVLSARSKQLRDFQSPLSSPLPTEDTTTGVFGWKRSKSPAKTPVTSNGSVPAPAGGDVSKEERRRRKINEMDQHIKQISGTLKEFI